MVFLILRVMFMQGKRSSFADLMDDDAMNFGQHSFFLLSILSCLVTFPRMWCDASFVEEPPGHTKRTPGGVLSIRKDDISIPLW